MNKADKHDKNKNNYMKASLQTLFKGLWGF